MTNYRTADVAVNGGELRVGVFDSDDVAAGAAPDTVILAIHGVTANHRAWLLPAELLTRRSGVRVLAPDLRGRARSNALPPPYGMAAHADDLAAVLAALDAPPARVIGHSMGGFVATVLAHRHPERVADLLLIDGGLPIDVPLPADEQALRTLLGPAQQRLQMSFGSRDEYRAFWRQHPALGPHWSDLVIDYVDYDLTPGDPPLRSGVNSAAVIDDSVDLQIGTDYLAALQNLPPDTNFLRAPTGLMAEPPGLYPVDQLEKLAGQLPNLRWSEVPDVNHYTIVMSEPGAQRIVAELFGES